MVNAVAVNCLMSVFADPRASSVPTDATAAQRDAAARSEWVDEGRYDTLAGRTEVQRRPATDHHGRVH